MLNFGCVSFLEKKYTQESRTSGDIPSLKLAASLHLKMDGWNTIVVFLDGLFVGELLVLGSLTASFFFEFATEAWIVFSQQKCGSTFGVFI